MPIASKAWEYVVRVAIPILLLLSASMGAMLFGMQEGVKDNDKRIAVLQAETVEARELLEALATIRREVADGNAVLRERIQAIEVRLTRIETILRKGE